MKSTALVFSAIALLIACSAEKAPGEESMGKSKGYPIGTQANWFYEESVRVGSFSNLDKIFPQSTLSKSATPRPLNRAATEPAIRYSFKGKTNGIDDFLKHQRVSGLLVVKNGEILVERYQYERQPTHRFVGHSMAKSITSLALGFALEEERISSLDDKVSKYVPELAGYPYGDIKIRSALRMASGVRFNESYSGHDDLAAFVALWRKNGMVQALQAYDKRDAPEGTRFQYDSPQAFLIGLVVKGATGQSVSDYLATRLWKPMGAEADASWTVDKEGLVTSAGHFSAVLRDYGRLGVLLADDGAIDGKQVLPKSYLLEATDWRKHPEAFAPRKATPYFGYGYQFWLLPGEKRRFVLMGSYGQMIYVAPDLKLVLVHTGVGKNANIFGDGSMGAESLALWSGLETAYSSNSASIEPPPGVKKILGELESAWRENDIERVMALYHPQFKHDGRDKKAQWEAIAYSLMPRFRKWQVHIRTFRQEGNIAIIESDIVTDGPTIPVTSSVIEENGRWYFYGNRQ